jgi:hypothetical protein
VHEQVDSMILNLNGPSHDPTYDRHQTVPTSASSSYSVELQTVKRVSCDR